MSAESYKFDREFQRGDMTHRGPGDFYERNEQGLLAAIASGLPFDTGWRGCKHEILSSFVRRDEDGTFHVGVSVSDDFDTEGRGEQQVPMTPEITDPEIILKLIKGALGACHDSAAEDQEANAGYRGFTILNRRRQWVETYIQPWGEYNWDDHPPGDEYYCFGFQGECRLPPDVREVLSSWVEAWNYVPGRADEHTYKGWTIRPWLCSEAHREAEMREYKARIQLLVTSRRGESNCDVYGGKFHWEVCKGDKGGAWKASVALPYTMRRKAERFLSKMPPEMIPVGVTIAVPGTSCRVVRHKPESD